MNFIYAENLNIWGAGEFFLQEEELLTEKGRRVLMVRYMVPGGGGGGAGQYLVYHQGSLYVPVQPATYSSPSNLVAWIFWL